ncbi:MAG: hypothetical protein WCW84_06735 [Sulfurimonas sp.]|jgi:hypothetical protein
MKIPILKVDEKAAIDNLITVVNLETDWQKGPSLFLKLFDEINIIGDPLVEDYVYSHYRYLPLSIYMLSRMNDTAVSNAYFRTYKEYIAKEFVYPTSELYSYIQIFYKVISSHSSYPSTDNMLGAIFILRDLSFLKDVTREHGRGNTKAVNWLQFLHDQIDNYMEDGDNKEQFRKEIEDELAKAKAALLSEKKDIALGTLNNLFIKLSDINDPLFLDEIKQKFDKKLSKHTGVING